MNRPEGMVLTWTSTVPEILVLGLQSPTVLPVLTSLGVVHPSAPQKNRLCTVGRTKPLGTPFANRKQHNLLSTQDVLLTKNLRTCYCNSFFLAWWLLCAYGSYGRDVSLSKTIKLASCYSMNHIIKKLSS